MTFTNMDVCRKSDYISTYCSLFYNSQYMHRRYSAEETCTKVLLNYPLGGSTVFSPWAPPNYINYTLIQNCTYHRVRSLIFLLVCSIYTYSTYRPPPYPQCTYFGGFSTVRYSLKRAISRWMPPRLLGRLRSLREWILLWIQSSRLVTSVS